MPTDPAVAAAAAARSPVTLAAHPLRAVLHDEVHARPYERMTAPLVLAHLALVATEGAREHVSALLAARGAPPLAPDANHVSADLGGGLRLRWEKHSEFHTCTFWRPLRDGDGLGDDALAGVPAEWLARLPGQWLVGLRLLAFEGRGEPAHEQAAARVREALHEDSLVGAAVMDGDAQVWTDFRLQPDGYARLLLVHRGFTPRRLGRTVQRLLEIETYRMMALLGLPSAREVGRALGGAERDLAGIASEVRSARREEEPELLRRLTQLAGEVESLYARTHARFSASAAYFELVQRRIADLREQRLEGLQTIGEFMDRRLAPAMQTCAWTARRQQALSERVSRTSNLLRTRVEIEQQQSSQDLLDAMNRRQQAQLLLQSAVEGLSVAAVTYYGAGLVGYLAKGLKAAGWASVSPDVAMAVSIPLIAIAVWAGLRRLHRVVEAAAARSDVARSG